MTPINSMLPIAAPATGEVAVEGSPLAGFGELIAGLILQDEQQFGSLGGGEQEEASPNAGEEQVSTAMLLASLPVPQAESTELIEESVPAVVEAELAPPLSDHSVDAGPPVSAEPMGEVPTAAAQMADEHAAPTPQVAAPNPAQQANLSAVPHGPGQQTATPIGPAGQRAGSQTVGPKVVATTAPSEPQTLVGNPPAAGGESSTVSDVEIAAGPVPAPSSAGASERSDTPIPSPVVESGTPSVGLGETSRPEHDPLGSRSQEPAARSINVDSVSSRPDPAPQPLSTPTPASVPSTRSAPVIEIPQTVLARVEQAIEMVENAPPPRRITIDAAELDGVRLTVSLRSDGVAVTSQTADTSIIEAIERALAARGFDLSDSGRQGRRPEDADDHDAWQPPTAPPTRQTTREQGIRL